MLHITDLSSFSPYARQHNIVYIIRLNKAEKKRQRMNEINATKGHYLTLDCQELVMIQQNIRTRVGVCNNRKTYISITINKKPLINDDVSINGIVPLNSFSSANNDCLYYG